MLSGKPKKEGRLSRHFRVAAELKDDPKQIAPLLRGAVLDVWCSRGGGFFGLGYLVAFAYFEISMLIEDVTATADLSGFAIGQLFEYLLRFGIMSFVNAFQALLWPVYILQLFEWIGIILLIGAYFAFEKSLKPGLESLFPELREHRERIQAEKAGRRSARKSGSKPDDGRDD